MLFAYRQRFDETLRPGAVYWPGENIKRFGLQVANIEPIMVSDRDDQFEYGEVIALDSNRRARKILTTDNATNFHGVVHRNASATMAVLDTQVMGMAPRLTLSVFLGGRQGVIAVPVQNITDFENGGDVAVGIGNAVYVRVKELGAEAPAWSDSDDYVVGQMTKHNDELYIAKEDHLNTASVEPGEATDWEDTWTLVDFTLPLGGIETASSDGECVEWTGVKFAEPATSPFKETKYTDSASPTTYVAGIELG